MLAVLQIGQKDVLVNCMHQSTNFPGRLDRASATFPLIMYYAVFSTYSFGSSGRSYSIQDETFINAQFKTKIIEPLYSVKHYVISIYNSLSHALLIQ